MRNLKWEMTYLPSHQISLKGDRTETKGSVTDLQSIELGCSLNH